MSALKWMVCVELKKAKWLVDQILIEILSIVHKQLTIVSLFQYNY